jgi:hypothetical protein
MRVILASILLAAAIAVPTGVVMYSAREPVYLAQPLPSVRIGDPGHNLVGPEWTGNVPREGAGTDGPRAADATGTRAE